MKVSSEATAHRQIILRILGQHYLPGVRLVESQVARELGMSRTPVRNALKRLVAEGLLEQEEGKGVSVPHLTGEDMRHVFHARLLIEGETAKLAAENATGEEIEELRAIVAEERRQYSLGNPEIFLLNDKIHRTVAHMSQNPYLLRALTQVFWRSELYSFFFDKFYVRVDPSTELLRDPEQSHSCMGHRELVKAIESRNPGLAERVMRDHVSTSFSDIVGRVKPGMEHSALPI